MREVQAASLSFAAALCWSLCRHVSQTWYTHSEHNCIPIVIVKTRSKDLLQSTAKATSEALRKGHQEIPIMISIKIVYILMLVAKSYQFSTLKLYDTAR